ncbi:putative lipoprotein [Leptospira fainei serovar Hurstbridge str. BUT 6]|uniref:Lipoprotein n=1 Tax=Leptospira fainei serovar Hurstbridge str. BUT 6 TaxID=1193011 RepID=S3UZF4_9LEPT|nr:lipoprotein [Leptospira fainei]EPG73749.1 putative lipoprotein [Leptospira fainei serovar Hurstbridge str. BUT 6]
MVLNRVLIVSFTILFFLFSCRDGCKSEENARDTQEKRDIAVSEVDKQEEKNLIIMKLNDPTIKGVYDISFSERWAPKLGSASQGSICAEIEPNQGKIKIKFSGQDNIFSLKLQPMEENNFKVLFENQEILKGVFILESKTPKGVHVKFFQLNEEINPQIRYDEVYSSGYLLENPIHVKSFKTILDCEMEQEISGCWESDEKNRPWKDCRPPGYNNLKYR